MHANPHLEPQLDAYLALNEPGFALMIDAPWGAGKTHAIRQWLVGKKHLLVSLYGATSRDDIERAIIVARLNAMDNNASRAVATVVDAGLEFAASYFQMPKPTGGRKIALAMLPDLIVFDDLERTEGIPVHTLLSVLNRYVEQEGRHVVLLANQEELRKGCEGYDRVREKVVGRVIALEPDEAGALEAFLGELRGRKAHAFLCDQQEAILSVFRTSECQNLRLLRQSLLEYARFHDKIPDDLLAQEEPMCYVMATFLALTIAFHESNDFGIEDLGQKDGSLTDAMLAHSKDKSLIPRGYYAFFKRYERHKYVRLYQLSVSGTLATSFIGKGYADLDVIERELRGASVFSSDDSSDWRTLWHWVHSSVLDVQKALQSLRTKLADRTVTDPATILHIGGVLLNLAKHNLIPESTEEVVQLMTTYVHELRIGGLLTPDLPILDWKSDPVISSSAYGLGYSDRDTDEFGKLRQELLSALDGAFWDKSPLVAGSLLKLAEEDLAIFLRSVREPTSDEGPINYAYIPLFAKTDPTKAAQLVCSLPPDHAHGVLGPFKGRIERLEIHTKPDWPSERTWLIEVRDEILKTAEATEDPIRRAQLHALIEWNLSFLDPAPETDT